MTNILHTARNGIAVCALYMHNDSNIMVNLKPGLVSDTLVR